MGNSLQKYLSFNNASTTTTTTVKEITLTTLPFHLEGKKTGYKIRIFGCSGDWILLESSNSIFSLKNIISNQVLITHQHQR